MCMTESISMGGNQVFGPTHLWRGRSWAAVGTLGMAQLILRGVLPTADHAGLLLLRLQKQQLPAALSALHRICR